MVIRNKKRKERSKDRRFLNFKLNKRLISLATKVSMVSFVSIIIVLVAYFISQYKIERASVRVEETLSGLLREENSSSVSRNLKIAIGFGSCQDIVVHSNEVIKDRPPKIPEHFNSISTREELLKVFAYFYQHGAAAERFVSNNTLFRELVHAAKSKPSSRYHIGGNAPIMAQRFISEGVSAILLGAQMSDDLRLLFSEKITVSGPMVNEDDVHLLLEYPAGQRWGVFVPPRANRFIVHNDHQNPQLSSLDTFIAKLENFNPNLLIISGLQMMDNFPMSESIQIEHLRRVQRLMETQPKKVRIHFEMASFSDEVLFKNLVDNIVPFADSLGMNEQELPNLYQMLKYGNVSLVAETQPRVASILDQARNVFDFLQKTRSTHGGRKLTRLHVHTLAFQAFLVDTDSKWRNTKAAAAKSALVANRHTCGNPKIQPNKAKLLMDEAFTTTDKAGGKRIPFDAKNPVSCWTENRIEICVAPILVCTDVVQTGGGGDNVSSSGLVLQI